MKKYLIIALVVIIGVATASYVKAEISALWTNGNVSVYKILNGDDALCYVASAPGAFGSTNVSISCVK